MSYYYSIPIVVSDDLADARRALGAGLSRIVGYFEEDGIRSVEQIEQALAALDPTAMVLPAHTLKGEAAQLGAPRLGELAETIEKTARDCVERHESPNEVASEVAMLRGCFVETLDQLHSMTKPSTTTPGPKLAQHGQAGPSPINADQRGFGRRSRG